jgi:hypothetical protein
MKKGLAVLVLVVAALLAALYLFIPASPSVTQRAFVSANEAAVYRCLTTESLLRKWWPRNDGISRSPDNKSVIATHGDLVFRITPGAFDIVSIVVEKGADTIQGFVTVLPVRQDSSVVSWNTELPAGGFFARLQRHFLKRKINKSIAGVLAHFQAFLQNEKNIYGISIHFETVTDTLLAVAKVRDTVKPAPEHYYSLIKTLRTYIADQGVQETNYPMLNILPTGSNAYETMVAIPVNKPIQDRGPVLMKRMVPGAILVAEVRGGTSTVEEGFRQLDVYVNEHRLWSQARPFQSLVTDRLAEPDTAKWITKLYYPVQ